jgi:hypothetical protein
MLENPCALMPPAEEVGVFAMPWLDSGTNDWPRLVATVEGKSARDEGGVREAESIPGRSNCDQHQERSTG